MLFEQSLIPSLFQLINQLQFIQHRLDGGRLLPMTIDRDAVLPIEELADIPLGKTVLADDLVIKSIDPGLRPSTPRTNAR